MSEAKQGLSHPLPWRMVLHNTIIALQDARGGVVAALPFSRSSKQSKVQAAELILQRVNETT